MKKLLIAFACMTGVMTTQLAFANPFKLDENALEQTFSNADEITVDEMAVNNLNSLTTTGAAPADVTMGGFMVRLIFCGQFALHRSYAGTKGLWWKYFCTLGFVAAIDFWYTVFNLDTALDNFNGNPNFVVWTKKGRQ